MDNSNEKTKRIYDEDTVSQSSENLENNGDQHRSTTKNGEKIKSSFKRKSYLRHFPNLDQERLLKRYSCALAGDFLLQGYLYITERYFAFYSNIFGYVTKLIIPILSVKDITKEKTAKIIPNAIGITTANKKHIFSSFLQRENSFEFLKKCWQEVIGELDEISDIDSEPELFYSSEEELSEKEDLNYDKVDPQPTLKNKGSLIPIKIKPPEIKISFHTFIWYSTIIFIILLSILSGILLYRIKKVQNEYSYGMAVDGNVKSNKGVLKNVFLEHPDFYSKSFLSINKFMDKNINTVSDVRKTLEILTNVLNNEKEDNTS